MMEKYFSSNKSKLLSSLPKLYKQELGNLFPSLNIAKTPYEPSLIQEGLIILFKKITKPLFIFLDDLHWSDESTLLFLPYLLRNLRNSPIFLCAALREEEETQSLKQILLGMSRDINIKFISLAPLTQNDIHNLLKDILKTDNSKKIDSTIYKETEGNPFFTVEIIKNMIQEENIVWKNKNWIINLPKRNFLPLTVHDALKRRLSNLSKETRDLLTLVSVIGHEFHIDLIQQISKKDQGFLLDLLEEGINLRILKENQILNKKISYSFTHSKFRDVLYQDISGTKKCYYHQKIAEALASQTQKISATTIEKVKYLGTISSHFLKAGLHTKALPYLIQAGKCAKEIYGNDEALNFFQEALKILKNYPKAFNEKISVLLEKAEILNRIGKNNKALRDLTMALNISNSIKNGRNKASCLLLQSDILASLSRYKDMLYSANSSLKLFQKYRNSKGIADSLNNIAYVYSIRGMHTKALQHYKRSLRIQRKIKNLKGEAYVLNNIGALYTTLNNNKKAIEYYQKSIHIQHNLGNLHGEATALNNLGTLYKNICEYEKAKESYKNSLKIRRKIGDRKGISYSLQNLAVIYDILGDNSKALKLYLHSLKIKDEIGDARGKVFCLINLAKIYLSNKNIAQVQRCLNQGWRLANKIEDKEAIRRITLLNGEVALLKKDFSEAKKILFQINKSFINSLQNRAHILLLLARLFYSLKNWKESNLYFQKSISIISKSDDRLLLGEAHYYYASALLKKGDFKKAIEHRNKAEKIFKTINSKTWLNNTRKLRIMKRLEFVNQ